MIRGYSYELEGRKGFLRFNFPDQGKHVAATIGDLDDAVAAPLWEWQVAKGGSLIIEEYDGSIVVQLNLIKFADDLVTVQIRGNQEQYNR